jgi:flagellar hook-associated protein 2
MAGIALSGLASGVDTSSIVAQLMAVERQKTTVITNKQAKAQAEQDNLKGIAAKLTALKTAADALKKSGPAWTSSQTVESSDGGKVVASKVSGAGIGGHSVLVDRLAASAQRGFSVGDLTAGGSITIGSGTKDATTGAWSKSTTFAFDATATPATIADQINGRADAPVYAAVVKNAAGEDRLVLSARTTGESGRFEATAAGPLTEDTAYASPAASLNARYRIDGSSTVQESETNTLNSAIPGLRLTLKGVTSTPVSVTVAQPDINRDAIKTKVKALVDAYNAVVDTTRADTDEKSVANPSTTADLQKGTLFGDRGLSNMLSGLRNTLRDSIAGLTGVDDLSDIGIGVPAASGGASSDDAKAGHFTLDADKLAGALDTDWTKVAAFLDGFAGKVDAAVEKQTGTKSSLLDLRVKSQGTTLKDLATQLADMNTRLDAEEARYKSQFAAMESAMANYQSQQAWLTGQINSLG